jgi:hypothetical protein
MNKYKKITILFAAIFFTSLQAFSQNSLVDKFINQYAGDSRFSFISINPQASQIGDPDYALITTNITSLRILKTKTTPDLFFQEAVSKLARPPYEVMMNVQRNGKNIEYLALKNKNNQVIETIMIVGKVDKFVLTDMKGSDISINLGAMD